MAAEQTETLQKIDTKLSALLAILIEDLLRRTPDMADPRPRSIDKLLADVGLTGVEIAALLGKTPQAVSNQLAAAKKAVAKKPATKTTVSTKKAN